MTAWTYMLQCSDGTYYVGSTRASLEHRVTEHQEGTHRGYTFSRRPVSLVWSQDFTAITDAIAAERQIKGWRRAKKEALIRGDFDLLPALSRRHTTSSQQTSGADRSNRTPFETPLRGSSG